MNFLRNGKESHNIAIVRLCLFIETFWVSWRCLFRLLVKILKKTLGVFLLLFETNLDLNELSHVTLFLEPVTQI